MSRIKSFKKSLFYKNSKKLKLVQFWSTWCGVCIDTKHLEIFLRKNSGIEIYRLNVDEYPVYANKHSIVVLPTYIFFKDLNPILTLVGKQTAESLCDAICKISPKSKLAKKSPKNY